MLNENVSFVNEQPLPNHSKPNIGPKEHQPNNTQLQIGPHLPSPHPGENIPILNQSSELRFYQEFKRIYSVSFHLSLEKNRWLERAQNLSKRLNTIEVKMSGIQEKMKDSKYIQPVKKEVTSEQNRFRRSRRTAQQIQKKFKCEVEFCERLYGSEGSLQQHIKLKHPELYRKDVSGSEQQSERKKNS